MKRKCEACPAEVMAVCRHAFGRLWDAKSGSGEGCDHPLDDVAEAWRKAGWAPDNGVTHTLAPPLPDRPALKHGEMKLTSLLEKYRKGIRK